MTKGNLRRAAAALGLLLSAGLLWALATHQTAIEGLLVLIVPAYTLVTSVLYFAWWQPSRRWRPEAWLMYLFAGMVAIILVAVVLVR